MEVDSFVFITESLFPSYIYPFGNPSPGSSLEPLVIYVT